MSDINSKYSVLNRNDVEFVLGRYLEDKKFSITEYFLANLSENACGFIAEHAILTIKADVENYHEVHSFFLKKSSNEMTVHGKYIEEIGAFKKEVQLFNSLIPLLQKCSSRQWSPNCFLARKDLLIFENLSTKGYRNACHKVKSILDLEHCIEGVKALARFHAASKIFESKHGQQPQKTSGILNKFGDMLRENTYVSDATNPRKEWLDVGVRATLALMRLVPELNTPDVLSKIDKKLPEIFLELPEVVKPSSEYRNVVAHGDIWANNMMFRYENGKPVDCVLVDYQFARYAAAALDLMCMTHLTTTRQFRKCHMQDVIKVYYKVVQEELMLHKLDVNILMPYPEFIAASKHFSRPALVEAIIFGHTIILPEELAVKILESPGGYAGFVLGDRETILLQAWEDKEFREIMTDRLVELVEEYIL